MADDEPLVDDGRYERRSESLEFERVAFFSDAVFAIAMTLLVVGIGIPHVTSGDFRHTLSNKGAEIFSFFLSFVVIGFYWLAHHRFFSQLRAVERRFMELNLLYLAAIAFMPFPTALVGSYGDDPIVVVIYAATLGVASLLDGLMFARAHVAGLMRVKLRADVFRYALLASTAPVVVFAIAIPVAYVDTGWALATFVLIFPIELVIDRLAKPADADEMLRRRR
jgi:uncharacterized membrane protein